MIQRKDFYKDYIIRFVILPESKLLINTNDFCKVIDININDRRELLLETGIDKTSAIIAAAASSHPEAPDFLEWLVITFRNFPAETQVRPSGGNIWDYE